MDALSPPPPFSLSMNIVSTLQNTRSIHLLQIRSERPVLAHKQCELVSMKVFEVRGSIFPGLIQKSFSRVLYITVLAILKVPLKPTGLHCITIKS